MTKNMISKLTDELKRSFSRRQVLNPGEMAAVAERWERQRQASMDQEREAKRRLTATIDRIGQSTL